MKKESPNNKNNRLRDENWEKKKKLEEEFGAGYWSKLKDGELPPEIEGQFLDHIMSFENAWKDAKQLSLYEFMGKPPYRKTEELREDEIHNELNRLYELMNQYQVSLDTICEVPEREIYRFITDELFQQEIDDMHIPCMITHYTYEEFHPNHAYDIEKHSTDFIKTYLDKESEYYSTFLSSDAIKKEWHKHFRDSFSSFELAKFEITGLKYELDRNQGQVDFECDFVGVVDGSREKIWFNGNGTFQLVYQWDFWCVDSVEFPKN